MPLKSLSLQPGKEGGGTLKCLLQGAIHNPPRLIVTDAAHTTTGPFSVPFAGHRCTCEHVLDCAPPPMLRQGLFLEPEVANLTGLAHQLDQRVACSITQVLDYRRATRPSQQGPGLIPHDCTASSLPIKLSPHAHSKTQKLPNTTSGSVTRGVDP